MWNIFKMQLIDKIKQLFLLLIIYAYEMSGGEKPYIKLIVRLVIVKLLTLLSTVFVDNKKYLIESVGLAQQYRNLGKKSY